MIVPKDYPDHHDAELVIKLYELRREATMRESRAVISRDFLPKSLDDIQAVLRADHPLNAPYRQCGSYWEMVYGMARHGVIHADFMMESNGEGLLLFTRVEPWLAEIRTHGSPLAFRNAEWVATETDTGRRTAERFRARVRAFLNTDGGR
ncbi:MAG: hypothetical protein ABIT38_15920 [Gemmatimonadaceae bacterium]